MLVWTCYKISLSLLFRVFPVPLSLISLPIFCFSDDGSSASDGSSDDSAPGSGRKTEGELKTENRCVCVRDEKRRVCDEERRVCVVIPPGLDAMVYRGRKTFFFTMKHVETIDMNFGFPMYEVSTTRTHAARS